MQDAAAVHAARRAAAAAVQITITDGTNTSGEIDAVLGTTVREIENAQSDTLIKVEYVDFHVKTADLILDSVQTEPKHGMRISYSGRVYEVRPINAGEQCFSWSDPYRTMMRIHTVQIT